MIGRVLSLTMLAETLRMAVPYVCAALGGVVSERAGVVDVCLEGLLLTSAFASIAASLATGSPLVGALAGVAAAMLVASVHALVVVRGRVDGIVSGIAVNLFAFAGTRFLLRAFYDSASNSPMAPGFELGFEGAGGVATLSRVVFDPLSLVALALVVAVPFWLERTRSGLRLRAAGESPAALRLAGLDPSRIRIVAVVVAGALSGVGGVHLAYDQRHFEPGMSGGRGFIALAAVIVSGWRARRAALACLVFAALDALQIVLQDEARVPHEIVQALPYVATLAALSAFAVRAPAALGRVDDEV